jgi:hypothetical protein
MRTTKLDICARVAGGLLAALFTSAVPRPAPADEVTAKAVPRSWQAGLTFQDALGAEYLKAQQGDLVTHASKAKLTLVAQPAPAVLMAVTLLGKHYSGATTIPTDGYLPDETRAALVGPNAADGAPGTAELVTYHLVDSLGLHEAYGEARSEHLRLRAGRQLFGVGAGKAFRPTDLFNFTYPGDPMWEPIGHDGLALAAALPASVDLEGFVELGPRMQNSNWVLRAAAAHGSWRLGFSFTRHWAARTDWQAVNTPLALATLANGHLERFVRTFRWDQPAADVTGSVAGVNLRAEAGYAFLHAPAQEGTLSRAGENHLRLLVGADHAFARGASALIEYMYLGQGRNRGDELDLNDRLGLLAGEVLSVSQHLIFFATAQDVGSRLAIGLRGTAIPMDPVNVMLFPFVNLRLAESAALELYGTVPAGPERGVIGKTGPSIFLWLRFVATVNQS